LVNIFDQEGFLLRTSEKIFGLSKVRFLLSLFVSLDLSEIHGNSRDAFNVLLGALAIGAFVHGGKGAWVFRNAVHL